LQSLYTQDPKTQWAVQGIQSGAFGPDIDDIPAAKVFLGFPKLRPILTKEAPAATCPIHLKKARREEAPSLTFLISSGMFSMKSTFLSNQWLLRQMSGSFKTIL
jgi:hypothetical protein